MITQGIKYLTVEQLRKVLDTVPKDGLLVANGVGNLSVVTLGSDGLFTYMGFIDFLHQGEYVP